MPNPSEGQLMITDKDAEFAIEPKHRPSDNQSLMQIIEKVAASPDINVDKLQKLLELKTAWDAIEARKAFHAAMAKFKENPPEITKNKHVKFGNTEYDHATLDHVTDAITEGLSKVGIMHRWTVDQKEQAISVSCVLTHEQGHCEKTTMTANPDTSGSKNAIQAIGSAVTYLQRYTLLAACGLAAQNGDDDGVSSGSVESDWLSERVEWIASSRNIDELSKIFRDAYKVAAAAKDQKAMRRLIESKDKRKADFQCE